MADCGSSSWRTVLSLNRAADSTTRADVTARGRSFTFELRLCIRSPSFPLWEKISPYLKIHQHPSGSRDTTNVLYTSHAAALKNENRSFSGPDQAERILFSSCFLKVVSVFYAAYASRAPCTFLHMRSERLELVDVIVVLSLPQTPQNSIIINLELTVIQAKLLDRRFVFPVFSVQHTHWEHPLNWSQCSFMQMLFILQLAKCLLTRKLTTSTDSWFGGCLVNPNTPNKKKCSFFKRLNKNRQHCASSDLQPV